MIKAMNDANVPRTPTLASETWPSKDTYGGELESAPDSQRKPIRMLKLSQVVERTGRGKTSIYELQKGNRFPQSVHVTGHSVRWIEAEVETWLEQHAQARTSRA